MEFEHILDVAEHSAKVAAEIIIAAADQPKTTDYKGRTDLVTQTDQEAELIICKTINEHFPDHGILAEETGVYRPESDFQWIIDPIDGTTNFVHNYPSFAVSIGIHNKHKPIVGCIIELPANNVYKSVKDRGAYCNDDKLSVSSVDNLEQSLLVTGFGYKHGQLWEKNMHLFKHFTQLSQGVRRLGAASVDLCHIASGKIDGFWEYDLQPWDTAAGVLIANEAGGKITKMDGADFSVFDDEIVASNGLLHAVLMENMIFN